MWIICFFLSRTWRNSLSDFSAPWRPSVDRMAMVWSEMYHCRSSNLVILDGTTNRHRYTQILGYHILLWAEGVFGRSFMQENAPPHGACDTVSYLDQHDAEAMDRPGMSPDMSPIEHVWDQLSIWIRDMDRRYSNLANCVTLVESMPRRVRTVLGARGGTRAISNNITSVLTWPIHTPWGLVIWL